MKALETFFSIIHVLVACFLVLVVLLQQGKGGGMAGFGGGTATQVFGGSGAGNVLTRATWIFASIFLVTSVSLASIPRWSDKSFQAKLEEKVKAKAKKKADAVARPKEEAPKDAPATPAPVPPTPAPATP
jgi:preprotein translocase subunit SecG